MRASQTRSIPIVRSINELTAASAQSMRLIVSFTKGRGTLSYMDISCDSWLVLGFENALILG